MDLLQLKRVANFLGLNARPVKVQDAATIGIIGASQVSTYALIYPARFVPSAKIAAVAARDSSRAQKFAQKHGIPRSYGSYDELLADPSLDAVYVGLPNGLHGHWTRRALEAGKHVLCEKPFGANAAETRELQKLALKKGLICREAFHYREHPLARRLRQITMGTPCASSSSRQAMQLPEWMAKPALSDGLLGKLTSIDVQVLIPKWVFGDSNIRFLEDLAGGAMMDAGTYAVNSMRLLTGTQPRVESAHASMRPGSQVVDGAMRARLSFPSMPDLRGTLHASLQHDGWLPEAVINVEGDRGFLNCKGFIVPFFGHRLRVIAKHSQPVGNRSKDVDMRLLHQVKQQGGPPSTCAPTLTSCDEPAAAAAAAAALAASSSLLGSAPPHARRIWMHDQACGWEERAFGSQQQTTYFHQLERFTTDLQVLEGRSTERDVSSIRAACAFDAEDSVANAEVLDACYRCAGLPLRLPTLERKQRSL